MLLPCGLYPHRAKRRRHGDAREEEGALGSCSRTDGEKGKELWGAAAGRMGKRKVLQKVLVEHNAGRQKVSKKRSATARLRQEAAENSEKGVQRRGSRSFQ